MLLVRAVQRAVGLRANRWARRIYSPSARALLLGLGARAAPAGGALLGLSCRAANTRRCQHHTLCASLRPVAAAVTGATWSMLCSPSASMRAALLREGLCRQAAWWGRPSARTVGAWAACALQRHLSSVVITAGCGRGAPSQGVRQEPSAQAGGQVVVHRRLEAAARPAASVRASWSALLSMCVLVLASPSALGSLVCQPHRGGHGTCRLGAAWQCSGPTATCEPVRSLRQSLLPRLCTAEGARVTFGARCSSTCRNRLFNLFKVAAVGWSQRAPGAHISSLRGRQSPGQRLEERAPALSSRVKRASRTDAACWWPRGHGAGAGATGLVAGRSAAALGCCCRWARATLRSGDREQRPAAPLPSLPVAAPNMAGPRPPLTCGLATTPVTKCDAGTADVGGAAAAVGVLRALLSV